MLIRAKPRNHLWSLLSATSAACVLSWACTTAPAAPPATAGPANQLAAAGAPTTPPVAAPPPQPTAAAGGASQSGGFTCPQKGGTFTFALAGNPAGPDPQINGSSAQLWDILNQIYDQLITPPDVGKTDYRPSLATSWDISADNLTYTFHLRSGATFSDGTPFNAAAVKANVERIQGQPTAIAYPAFTGVTVLTPSETTIVFQRDAVRATFMNDIAAASFSQISPKVLMADPSQDNVVKHPIGTGPYVFAEQVADDHVTLTPNPTWWGGQACLDKVVFRVIPDSASRLLELQSGNIQGMNNVPADQVASISQNFTIFSRSSCRVDGIAFNVSRPGPVGDPKFREGMRYAVNQDAILKAIDPTGKYKILTSWLTPDGWLFDQTASQMYVYDLAKAKSIWTAAGYAYNTEGQLTDPKTGQAVVLDFPNGAFNDFFAQVVQGELAKSGVNTNLKNIEKDTYYNQYLYAGNFDITLWNSESETCDPSEMFEQLRSTNPQNVPHIKDPQIDSLLDKGLATTSIDDRKTIYTQLLNYIEPMNLYAFIGEKFPQDNHAVSKSVMGFRQDRYRVFKLDQTYLTR